jgi:hypothetical protein
MRFSGSEMSVSFACRKNENGRRDVEAAEPEVGKLQAGQDDLIQGFLPGRGSLEGCHWHQLMGSKQGGEIQGGIQLHRKARADFAPGVHGRQYSRHHESAG